MKESAGGAVQERPKKTRRSSFAEMQARIDALEAEVSAAREREAATAEVLQVINSSPGDLVPVFDAVLEKAMRLCDAAHGHVFRIKDGEARVLAAVGNPDFVEWILGLSPLPPVPGSLVERMMRGEDVVHTRDSRDGEPYRTSTLVREIIDRSGVRTTLGVALRHDHKLIGGILLTRREARLFSDKQIALLQNFSAQAVVAIENARLLEETREALEQQTATAEVLQVINSSPGDLAPVFEAMLEKAMALCGVAHGTLQTYDGEQFRAVAIRGLPEPLAGLLRQGFRPGPKLPMRRLLDGERFVQVPDLTQLDEPEVQEQVRVAVEAGVRTVLFVPLRRDDAFLGLISAGRLEVQPFTDKQIALLQNFAAQAVIAMENARLLTETREALKQQTATAEVLQVINSSPGDLAPVFDAILEKAHNLCGVEYGALFLFDGEKFRAVAVRGYPENLEQLVRRPYSLEPNSPVRALLRVEALVEIPNVIAHQAEAPNPRAEVAIAVGIRGVLFLPLRRDNQLLGMITAARKKARPFSAKEIALLQNFAAQAVIAMENARLLDELRQRTDQVAELNRGLEARVAEQVEELGRVGRLKRFLAPQLAELIVSYGDEKILESHRREIVVVFCDLRGYTAFTETAEPEEVLDFLREYHGALGPLVAQFEGTLDQFSGDGIMVFFNDPVPIPDPAERAVKMAVAMREAAGALIAVWRRRDRELGFGVGIAQGYATLGQIGFAERSGYTAIGTVCNLAARLCAEAKDGQILISGRVAAGIEKVIPLEDLGSLALKGISQPVSAFNVPFAATQPALRVIEGGPPSG